MLSKTRIQQLEQALFQRAMDGDNRTGLALLRLYAAPQPTQDAGGGVILPPMLSDDDD